MKPIVVSLTDRHAEAAARLVEARLALLERDVPEIGTRCGSPQTLPSRIARLAVRGPGVAAIADGRLVGFLGAFPIRYGGRSSMLSPEWGNGVMTDVSPDVAARLFEALYASAAGEWVAAGAETHLVALLANDAAAPDPFSRFGFGRVVCDAVRSLHPVSLRGSTVSVRRATAEDAGVVCDLDRRLHAHLASPPVLLLVDDDEDEACWAGRLSDPTRAVWLAEQDGRPVGYLIVTPASATACDLIVDSGTSSITGAYVVPEARGGGVAAALLARAVDWAREQGYVRLAVDFETANIEGSRFWLRHFQPVVVSWARTIRACDVRQPL